jgi:DNA-damage-inducible protein D
VPLFHYSQGLPVVFFVSGPNRPIQTRRQEIEDELARANLPEDQKRLVFRSLMSTYNVRLAETAQRVGVIEPRDFATFQDHGYMGLY